MARSSSTHLKFERASVPNTSTGQVAKMKSSRKIEGVVEAVRLAPDGNMTLARVFERRGATFSDHILLNRAEFLQRLQTGKMYVTGKRSNLLGFTFNTGVEFHLVKENGQEVLRLAAKNAEQPAAGGSPVDDLKGCLLYTSPSPRDTR